MSDEKKNSTEQLVEKFLPTGVTDITQVLGGTEVDTTLDDINTSQSVNTAPPSASPIPKPPSGVITNAPQPAVPRAAAAIPASPNPNTPHNTNGTFESDSPYSKPPIFGSRIGRIISMVIGLALFVGMVGAIVYFLTSGRGFVLPGFLDPPSAPNTVTNTPSLTNQVNGNNSPGTLPINTSSDPVEASAGPTDTDGDGLLDSQENQVKTDPKKIDTDGDELTDRQEIEIYKTSPLKKDTDADGFSDGSEVRNFYNPNGNGQLLNVSEAINSISNSNANTNIQ